MEKDSLEAEHWKDLITCVEIDVSENVRHDVENNVAQARNPIQKECNALGGDALKEQYVHIMVQISQCTHLKESRHDDCVQIPTAQ